MAKQDETLEIHDLKGKLIAVQPRKSFYEEIKKEYKTKGKISRQVKTIRLLLLTSTGKIFLQRRSHSKDENPGMYDKTIGGHVKAGHTWYITVLQECYEELGFPAAILTEEDFRKAIASTDLSVIGLFRQVDYIQNFLSTRKTKSGIFTQPHMTAIYIGYYDGPIRFHDGESVGVEIFTLAELEKELKAHKEKFTEDLKFMIEKYRKYLVPISKVESTY